jgi:putative intracellular protease/amidase
MNTEALTILIVLTSHQQLGDTNESTGFWLEEFTTPYYAFLDAGIQVSLVTPLGGQAPIDPRSQADDAQTDSTKRFNRDQASINALANTKKLSEVSSADFDAIFYPGGHGPLWDLVSNQNSIEIIESFWSQGKPVSAVCHAPAVLLNVRDKNGDLIIQGKNVAGFTNSEEQAVGLTGIVPFLLEDALIANGAIYSKSEDFQEHVVVDGLLITGQNPASALGVANAVIELISNK